MKNKIHISQNFRTIAEMSDRINLPRNIVDRANALFKVASINFSSIFSFFQFYSFSSEVVHDGKSLKGRANDAIAAACLYIACRSSYCHCHCTMSTVWCSISDPTWRYIHPIHPPSNGIHPIEFVHFVHHGATSVDGLILLSNDHTGCLFNWDLPKTFELGPP